MIKRAFFAVALLIASSAQALTPKVKPKFQKTLISTPLLPKRHLLFFNKLIWPLEEVNKEILKDRHNLQRIQRKVFTLAPLSKEERSFLGQTAFDYKIKGCDSTRPVSTLKRQCDFKRLLQRVDMVPPSLAIAQSALETGWGEAKRAMQKCALFGQRYEGKVKEYESFKASIKAYIHNLNTFGSYKEFRLKRSELRKQGKPINGHNLAPYIHRYSERGKAYVEDVKGLILEYNLTAKDGF